MDSSRSIKRKILDNTEPLPLGIFTLYFAFVPDVFQSFSQTILKWV